MGGKKIIPNEQFQESWNNLTNIENNWSNNGWYQQNENNEIISILPKHFIKYDTNNQL